MIDSILNLVKSQLLNLLPTDESKIPADIDQYHYISLQIPIEKSIPLEAFDIENCFFLSKPDRGLTLLGLGSFLSFKSSGAQRFNSVKTNYIETLHRWKDKEQISPIAFHVFAFDENDPMTGYWQGIPNTLLTIPLVLIKEINSCQTFFINIDRRELYKEHNSYHNILNPIEDLLNKYFRKIMEPIDIKETKINFKDNEDFSTNTPSTSWMELCQTAIKAIQAGHYDKIVTTRQLSLPIEKDFSVHHLSHKLIKHYPTCTILSYHLSGKTMIAASPERLLSLQHPEIQSDAIGGTIHRKPLEQQLFSNSPHKQKLLKEHTFIAQDIYQRLDTFCHSLKMPVSPYLMKLQNMYHLETPVQGILKNQYDLFDLIENLHPTPAVAGYPAQESQQWLLENEAYHRGWYTGAFGWIDWMSNGKINGELSVMLRCALIDENQITLFAGAGLVAESNPEIEWLETELKMKTILEIL